MGEFLAALIAAPFLFIRDVVRLWLRWKKNVPLVQKMHLRAGAGGFLCALAIGLAVADLPWEIERLIEPYKWSLLIPILGGIGSLYLVGGVAGSRARFDYFSAAFWALAAFGFAALLIFKGTLV